MNYTRLVSLIKEVSKEKMNEATTVTRYGRSLSPKGRYKAYTTPQLAEDGKTSARTLTGSKANEINVDPKNDSNLEGIRGDRPPPPVDTQK